MDFFPDFNELGIWGYAVPVIVLIVVIIPIWKWSRQASQFPIQSRVRKTVMFSILVLVVLSLILLIVGAIVFQISNPGLQ